MFNSITIGKQSQLHTSTFSRNTLEKICIDPFPPSKLKMEYKYTVSFLAFGWQVEQENDNSLFKIL